MSQVTSHVLDTSTGRPASGIPVTLYRISNDEWMEINRDITNNDGRILNILPKDAEWQIGVYKLQFNTREYFNTSATKSLYPFIEIIFEITAQEHYHIPLLLNPYGYSTYRGS